MGVTIHFEGAVRDTSFFNELCREARAFADERNWPIEVIDENEVTLQRVRDESDWNYVGPVKGIAIQPHENSDPLRLEFDNEYYIQEYIKTQFAPTDCHTSIVELLKLLTPHFVKLDVVDEGEYFDCGDEGKLQNHIDRCFEMLEEYLQNSDKYYGPVKLGNGRIIDIMERD